jgi:cobalt/nickel transport system permease protein
MHIPDGFIDTPVSMVALSMSAVAIGVSLKRTKGQFEEAVAPMAGLAAVFIFAAQMVNFPVAAGTSGHLIGGALAAVLIGPYAAILAMTVVVALQAIIFADGGITALGLNIFNMSVLSVIVGWVVFRGVLRIKPSRAGVLVASFVAGFFNVIAAAVGFVIQFAFGGVGLVELSQVFTAMVSVHTLIGLGEGAITALVVGSVLSTRPDLVWGANDLLPKTELQIKSGAN